MLDIIEKISSYKFNRKYLLDKPKSVRGRSSDNSFMQEKLNWSPSIKLEYGLLKTYNWLEKQILQKDNIKKFSRY
jgi:GDP-D-mannose 3',5'-epimerase